MLTIDCDCQLPNSFGLAAQATRRLVAHTISDVLDAVAFADQQKLPLLPLGVGSNILMSPRIDACVLQLGQAQWSVIERGRDGVLIKVDGGYLWHDFVTSMLHAGYYGLENLAGIPGTVGAAPMQNIGAYGVEIASYVTQLEWVSFADKRLVVLTVDDCAFGYRTSRFKRQAQNTGKPAGIITAVYFRLRTAFTPQLDNRHLQSLNTDCSAGDLYTTVLAKRAKTLPASDLGNAGSFFTNPIVDKHTYQRLATDYPDMKYRSYNNQQYQIHAGWLIDKAGWKGYRDSKKPVGVYAHNALVLVNHKPDNASVFGEDVQELASEIQASVNNQFGILLTPEPNQW